MPQLQGYKGQVMATSYGGAARLSEGPGGLLRSARLNTAIYFRRAIGPTWQCIVRSRAFTNTVLLKAQSSDKDDGLRHKRRYSPVSNVSSGPDVHGSGHISKLGIRLVW